MEQLNPPMRNQRAAKSPNFFQRAKKCVVRFERLSRVGLRVHWGHRGGKSHSQCFIG